MAFCYRMSLIFAAILLIAPISSAADKPFVVFANPASEDDVFFKPMTDFMQAAADDLGFELKVYYGNRHHVQIDENIKAIFRQERLPDYLVGMNARDSGKAMLELAQTHGVKTVFINQSFVGDARLECGRPGEKYTDWLFEFLPDDIHSGHLLATTLFDAARARALAKGKPIYVIAISGHETSAASILREAGLKQAVAEYEDVRLEQLVHAGWKEGKAAELAAGLLKRHPETTVIWAASDLMARGAMAGAHSVDRIPGENILSGGVDWAQFAVQQVEQGSLETTIGGHFMDGAWALVMLYDHMHGVAVPKVSASEFSRLTKANVNDYRAHFGTGNWDKIDFRKFSKSLNSGLEAYDFGLDAVLEQMQ